MLCHWREVGSIPAISHCRIDRAGYFFLLELETKKHNSSINIGWSWFESGAGYSLLAMTPHGLGRASRWSLQIKTARAGSIPVCVLAWTSEPG